MTVKLKYQEIMWAEQKPDTYDGPECDQHRPRWYAYADGDKEGGFDSVLNMNPANFPAGTKVVVSVPCCPLCGVQVELCEMSDCEFDWKDWADGEYS